MKQGLLVVSLGAGTEQAAASIRAVEQAVAQQAPEMEFLRVFTSPAIRRLLAGRGEAVMGLDQALDRVAQNGCRDVFVQPTHLLYGLEYSRIKETVTAFSGRFSRLVLGKPLISDSQDLRSLAACAAAYPHSKEEALVLLGHGTAHFSNMVYPALQTALRLEGEENAYVGTIKGWPGFDEVLKQLRVQGHSKALLAPFMLAAGEHTIHDMAGNGPESWKSRLEAAGISVRCHMEGLGRLEGVLALYQKHFQELL